MIGFKWTGAGATLSPRAAKGEVIELVLYTRLDCELCREMEEVIGQVLPGFAARLEKVAVDGDAKLEARFGLEVPVLFVNGRKAFKYRCTARELQRRLTREAGT